MNLLKISKLFLVIFVCELAGIIGAFFSTPAVGTWYLELTKPAINPPAWVFAPVWTTLFAMMGIALFLVLEKGSKAKQTKIALGVFALQLILNILWSVIFFGLHNIGGALIEIIFLWFVILTTLIFFFKISKPAGLLFVPYLLWVSFAGYLNFLLWILN